MKDLGLFLCDMKGFLSDEINRIFLVIIFVAISIFMENYKLQQEIKETKVKLDNLQTSIKNNMESKNNKHEYRLINNVKKMEEVSGVNTILIMSE